LQLLILKFVCKKYFLEIDCIMFCRKKENTGDDVVGGKEEEEANGEIEYEVPEQPIQGKWEDLKALVRKGETMRSFMYGMVNGGPSVFANTLNDMKQLVWLTLLKEVECDDSQYTSYNAQYKCIETEV
jgi:hypothetical protein